MRFTTLASLVGAALAIMTAAPAEWTPAQGVVPRAPAPPAARRPAPPQFRTARSREPRRCKPQDGELGGSRFLLLQLRRDCEPGSVPLCAHLHLSPDDVARRLTPVKLWCSIPFDKET